MMMYGKRDDNDDDAMVKKPIIITDDPSPSGGKHIPYPSERIPSRTDVDNGCGCMRGMATRTT